MNMVQIFNFSCVAIAAIYAVTKAMNASDEGPIARGNIWTSIRDFLPLLSIGIVLILIQLAMNFIFGGDMFGMSIPVKDVLLLRNLSLNFALALIGYMWIAAMTGTIVGTIWSTVRRKNS